MRHTARNIHRRPRRRVVASSAAPNSRVLFLLCALAFVGAEVGGLPTQSASNSGGNSGPVRTVMDLMEVMLNRDILDMLANGGYDFRQPARIFLPPKFYSSALLDRGHMSPEEILGALSAPLQSRLGEGVASILSTPSLPSSASSSSSQRTPSFASIGGEADQQQAPAGAGSGTPGNGNGFNFGGKEQVVVLDAPDGSRINLISYSDSEVTLPATGGFGAGGNKGRDTPGKTVVLKSKPAANQHQQQQQQQRPLTSSITDQTVSPNVARLLPTSGVRFATDGRSSSSYSSDARSSTDRLRSALPGEPDVDYPIFGRVPETTFSCDKRHHGYYADVEARCQVFRVCANTDTTGRGFAFLCPNGTLFNQRHLVCDWYTNVRCTDSENYYHLNEAIGRMAASTGRPLVSDNRRKMMDVVMSMVTYPMRSLMEQMDGVGVLEERLGQGVEARPVLPATPVTEYTRAPQPVAPTTYLVPIRSELEPPLTEAKAPVPVNNYAPVGSPTFRPSNPSIPNPVYTPRVDDVYVSSLGTLSTDPDSGFDPVRSTLLTRTGLAPTGPSQTGTFPTSGYVGLQQTNRVSGENPPNFSKPDLGIQLIKADLVKTWDGPGQAVPLRLAPVPQSFPQPIFTPAVPQRFAERFPQPTSRQEQELLAPTGVLPPTSFSRTFSTGQQQPGHGSSVSQVAYPQHRFAPVSKVLSVQKVTVQPEHSSRGSFAGQGAPSATGFPVQRPHGGHVSAGNLYHTGGVSAGSTFVQQPTSLAATGFVPAGFGNPNVQQGGPSFNQNGNFQLRRNDGPQPFRGSGSLLQRKKAVLVQVVPSLSFYLNNPVEKRAFDEAIRRRLFEQR